MLSYCCLILLRRSVAGSFSLLVLAVVVLVVPFALVVALVVAVVVVLSHWCRYGTSCGGSRREDVI